MGHGSRIGGGKSVESESEMKLKDLFFTGVLCAVSQSFIIRVVTRTQHPPN